MPTPAVREIFAVACGACVAGADGAPRFPFEGRYTAAQCAEVVQAYVKVRGLSAAASHPSRCVLDPTLSDALVKPALRRGERFPTELLRAELPPLLVTRMERVHRVARGGAEALRRGALPPVRVVTEMRSGNKKVTRVSGLEEFLVPLEVRTPPPAAQQSAHRCCSPLALLPPTEARLSPQELAPELQLRFAASCTVAELPFSSKQGVKPLREIVLQGNHCAAVGAHLTERYGVPKQYISLPVKKKKKKGAVPAAGGEGGAEAGGGGGGDGGATQPSCSSSEDNDES